MLRNSRYIQQLNVFLLYDGSVEKQTGSLKVHRLLIYCNIVQCDVSDM